MLQLLLSTPDCSSRNIVALAPDLKRVCFYCETEFLHHSSTIKLLLFP